MMDSISMVIPFYNEADYINVTVPKALEVLGSITNDFEIVLVNDGSIDGSSELASHLSNRYGNIRVVSHIENMGLGMALRSGFATSQKDLIIYTDMDMPFDLEALRSILPQMTGQDMVRGIRSPVRETLSRSLYAAGYRFLLLLVFGVWENDINFALKVFRREALKDLSLKANGSFIDAELILKFFALGKKVRSVEIAYTPRVYGVSHLANLRNMVQTVKEMLRLRNEINRFRSRYRLLKSQNSLSP